MIHPIEWLTEQLQKPWHVWIEFTGRRARKKAALDVFLCGSSYKERRWWGWRRINPLHVYVTKIDARKGIR